MKLLTKHGSDATQGGIIPGRHVHVTGEMVHVIVPQDTAEEPLAESPAPADEPQVALVREGDVIQAIEVTCTCGHKIRLRCVY